MAVSLITHVPKNTEKIVQNFEKTKMCTEALPNSSYRTIMGLSKKWTKNSFIDLLFALCNSMQVLCIPSSRKQTQRTQLQDCIMKLRKLQRLHKKNHFDFKFLGIFITTVIAAAEVEGWRNELFWNRLFATHVIKNIQILLKLSSQIFLSNLDRLSC